MAWFKDSSKDTMELPVAATRKGSRTKTGAKKSTGTKPGAKQNSSTKTTKARKSGPANAKSTGRKGNVSSRAEKKKNILTAGARSNRNSDSTKNPATRKAEKIKKKTLGKKPKSKRPKFRRPKAWVIVLLVFLVAFGAAYFSGLLDGESSVTDPTNERSYEVHGIDVSNYQRNINWDTLATDNLSFVFIKATEGGDFVDPYFSANWTGVQSTHLRYGAYHYVNLSVPGAVQALNFCTIVPRDDKALPPVIDFELDGEYLTNPPTQEDVDAILVPLSEILEEQYGKKPIIYTARAYYSGYIAGRYDNPIWISDPELSPTLPDGRDWLFCQYSFEGQLDGYDGIKNIDLNVFHGTPEELQEL